MAIKKDPLNEELHSHLFMAFVRMSDYKKQHFAAMALYKLKAKNPYYFWAVMSIFMQVFIDSFCMTKVFIIALVKTSLLFCESLTLIIQYFIILIEFSHYYMI